jgi:hypothetical protein
MEFHSKNGNGGAEILPPTTKVITGQSLAHRQLDKRQRACLAADVLDGMVRFTPTMAQIASILNVSPTYVLAASKLTPGKRNAILRGGDPVSFTDLVRPTRQLQLRLPTPNCASITNSYLKTVIRAAGVERTLEAACAVESA